VSFYNLPSRTIQLSFLEPSTRATKWKAHCIPSIGMRGKLPCNRHRCKTIKAGRKCDQCFPSADGSCGIAGVCRSLFGIWRGVSEISPTPRLVPLYPFDAAAPQHQAPPAITAMPFGEHGADPNCSIARFRASSAPPRTNLVSASGSKSRATPSSPPQTRRARTRPSTRSWLMPRSSSPLRMFIMPPPHLKTPGLTYP
jgi:hypothetical protein